MSAPVPGSWRPKTWSAAEAGSSRPLAPMAETSVQESRLGPSAMLLWDGTRREALRRRRDSSTGRQCWMMRIPSLLRVKALARLARAVSLSMNAAEDGVPEVETECVWQELALMDQLVLAGTSGPGAGHCRREGKAPGLTKVRSDGTGAQAAHWRMCNARWFARAVDPQMGAGTWRALQDVDAQELRGSHLMRFQLDRSARLAVDIAHGDDRLAGPRRRACSAGARSNRRLLRSWTAVARRRASSEGERPVSAWTAARIPAGGAASATAGCGSRRARSHHWRGLRGTRRTARWRLRS